jgi:hypothetical protein
LVEHVAQPLLRLAVEAAHDLRAGDVEEARLGLIGHGARQQRLAGAGVAVEEHALGRLDAQPLERLGMFGRQLDHLAHLLDGLPQASDVIAGRVGRAWLLGLYILWQELELGILRHRHHAARRGRRHHQADLLQPIGRLPEEGAQDLLGK